MAIVKPQISAMEVSKAQKVSMKREKNRVTITNTVTEEIVLEIKQWGNTHACYLLSFNISKKTGEKPLHMYQIVDFLLDNIVFDYKLVRPIRSTFIFVSNLKLPEIQNKFSNAFSSVEFVIGRLNRTEFPAMKHCNKQLQTAIKKQIDDKKRKNQSITNPN